MRIHWPDRFYMRLGGAFLLLITLLGAVLSWLSVHTSMRLFEEADQQLNRTLAQDMAVLFEPYLADSIDTGEISRIIERLEGLNRHIEIHLLGRNGMVKASFLKREQPLATPTVDLEPIQAWMGGADPPVLGSDPLSPSVRKPFSVASVTIMGETGCYLYIILGGMRFDSAAAMIENSYILRGSLVGGGLILLFTALAGLLLLALLTRRLRVMTLAVGEFEQGRFDARVPEASGDELGRLGRGFNRMADTIVGTLDRLRGADEQRRELVANVSHDLRNPLALLQGYLETLLMKEDTLAPAERRHYTGIGLVSARRLSGLVEQLFELSRLDAREIQPHPEEFPLQELAQDLVLQMQPRAAEKRLALTLDHDESLPDVSADIAMIERAVANLLDNALKHTPSGSTVTLVLSRAPGGVRLEVRDTGPGIPPEELPRIFERFYRVEKSRADSVGESGAGLGLAIARKLIALCGGQLQVESTSGSGSCFHFTLPISTSQPASRGNVTLS